MAKTQKLKAVLILFFFLTLFATSSVSSARVLNGFLSHDLAATEPSLNLALPLEVEVEVEVDVVLDKSAPTSEEQDPIPSKPHVLPCDHMVRMKNTHVGLRRPPRLTGMVLNMLPKGRIPPSGPGKGTNEIKN